MSEQNESQYADFEEVEPDLGSPDFASLGLDDEPEIHDETPKDTPKAFQCGALITVMVDMGFKFVAKRNGKHWILAPEEKQELAQATDAVIDEYFPDMEASPLMMLAAVGVGITAPRLMIDAKLKAQADAEKQQTQEKAQNADTSEETAAA